MEFSNPNIYEQENRKTFNELRTSIEEGTCTFQNLDGAYTRRGTPNAITLEQHSELSSLLGRQLEKKVENLEEKDGIDSLTGCFNENSLLKKLPALIMQLNMESKRRNSSIDSIMVIGADIDCFKRVNDTLGHPVGNKAIRAAVARFREAIKEFGGDLVFRPHGDEFRVVLLIRGDLAEDKFEEIFKRIQVKVNEKLVVRDIDTDEQGNPLNKFKPFNITLAMGYEVFKKGMFKGINPVEISNNLIKAADLKQIKDKGKIRDARMQRYESDLISV